MKQNKTKRKKKKVQLVLSISAGWVKVNYIYIFRNKRFDIAVYSHLLLLVPEGEDDAKPNFLGLLPITRPPPPPKRGGGGRDRIQTSIHRNETSSEKLYGIDSLSHTKFRCVLENIHICDWSTTHISLSLTFHSTFKVYRCQIRWKSALQTQRTLSDSLKNYHEKQKKGDCYVQTAMVGVKKKIKDERHRKIKE